MGTQTPLNAAPVVPEEVGANIISGWARPAAPNELTMPALVDAHNADGMPWDEWMPALIPASGAGPATPSEPWAPQASSSFDPSVSSLQLPFLNDCDACTFGPDPSPCVPQDQTASKSPDPSLFAHANCLPLFYTFFLSPSASRSSVASSLWSSDLSSDDSRGTQSTIMPGPTLDLPADSFLAPVTTDYSATPSACAPAESTASTTRLRPHSADSGRNERSGSPLIFARWARRHHHHGQESSKLKGPDRDSAERKPSSKSSPKRPGRSRSNSIQKRQPQAGAVPQMTREEFEALPLAIQRKVCGHLLHCLLFTFFSLCFLFTFRSPLARRLACFRHRRIEDTAAARWHPCLLCLGQNGFASRLGKSHAPSQHLCRHWLILQVLSAGACTSSSPSHSHCLCPMGTA